MLEFAILAVVWAGFLWLLAVTPPDRMKMIWLLAVLLVLLSPVLIFIFPQAR